jgi:prepilin-type N-terminal cleavage/methylation domain-containing protein
MYRQGRSGFTIVELLIVVVVIAILAAVSIVAYTNIQNRTYDSAVQSDLRNAGQQILSYQATEGVLPSTSAHYALLGLKSTRTAYGNGYSSNNFNFAYCRDTVTAGQFAVIAASKSGNVYIFKDGSVKQGVGPMGSIVPMCTANGLSNAENIATNWFFGSGAWKAWMSE